MNIKETEELFDTVPLEQAIMLEGIHGIGKSEIVKEYFESKGYKVYIFFGATAEDVGDIAGLPRHETIKVRTPEGTIEELTFTQYSAPYWWPTEKSLDDSIKNLVEQSSEESKEEIKEPKIMLFFDEFNRARPAIKNAMFELILNRQAFGRKLPRLTRIMAGINPFQEGFYEVDALDPALADRFIIIPFKPTLDEWIEFAYRNNLHQDVIDFIVQNTQFLDPDIQNPPKDGSKQPSRRSWHRVSNFLKANPSIKPDIFYNYLITCVGMTAMVKFKSFMSTRKRNIYAEAVLLEYTETLEKSLRKMINSGNGAEVTYFNLEIFYWFERNYALWSGDDKGSTKIFKNLLKYLDLLRPELKVHFCDKFLEQFYDSTGKDPKNAESIWADKFLQKCPEIQTFMEEAIRGKSNESNED